ncbi:MAG: PIG-L family deacetylase [Verrucomicrobiae bacterium]|nr:PIG-L family deacetylase [Verrucomicrobiae bacterium]
MNPYLKYVAGFARMVRKGQELPLGGIPIPRRAPVPPDAPVVMLFSPHPDDECIVGGLAVRLLREAEMRVINVAVTLGSKKERQLPRLAELREACRYLGFELVQTRPTGLEKVNPKRRSEDPAGWLEMVQIIADLLDRYWPRVVFFPHDRDWNSTHEGVHYLVADALREFGGVFSCWTVETEYWGQMTDPNLMVELTESDVADLIAATSFHVGEVQRNPYHLLLPAWMQDNVRRGGELVGGQGGAAPDFVFAVLYRLRRWRNGAFERPYPGGRNLPADTNPRTLFV